LRQQRGTLSQGAFVLTVRDRQEPLGSGGATLNALLVAAEHLSSRAGHTVSHTDDTHLFQERARISHLTDNRKLVLFVVVKT